MQRSTLLCTTAFIATVCLIGFAIIVFGFERGKPDNHVHEGTNEGHDYRPVFSDFNRDVDIFDGVFTENCLTVIVAKRFNDTHNAMPDKNIIYSLEDNKSFSIDNAGCLRMKTSFNTSMANGKLNWCIYIIASDEKYPMHNNKIAININLKKKIQTNNAQSYNNKSDENKVFEFLETTEFSSNETEPKYEISITTLDNKKTFENSTPKLNVEINKKQTKNQCKFSQPIYIAFVSINATVDTPVTKYLEVNNLGQAKFEIINNDTDDFSVSRANDNNENTNSIQIIVNKALSYSNKSVYEFYVLASEDTSYCITKINIYVRKQNDTGIIFRKKPDHNDESGDCFINFNYPAGIYIGENSTKCITTISAVDRYFENASVDSPIIYGISMDQLSNTSCFDSKEILKQPAVSIDEYTGCMRIEHYCHFYSSQKLAVQAYYKQDDSVKPLMSKFTFEIYLSREYENELFFYLQHKSQCEINNS